MAVINASFIVKLILKEPGTEKAVKTLNDILDNLEEIRAPDIALAEVLNVLWKHKVLLKDIDDKVLAKAENRLYNLWKELTIHDTNELGNDALKIAVKYKITIYDSLYITLAKKTKEKLYTFDRKLSSKIKTQDIDIVML